MYGSTIWEPYTGGREWAYEHAVKINWLCALSAVIDHISKRDVVGLEENVKGMKPLVIGEVPFCDYGTNEHQYRRKPCVRGCRERSKGVHVAR